MRLLWAIYLNPTECCWTEKSKNSKQPSYSRTLLSYSCRSRRLPSSNYKLKSLQARQALTNSIQNINFSKHNQNGHHQNTSKPPPSPTSPWNKSKNKSATLEDHLGSTSKEISPSPWKNPSTRPIIDDAVQKQQSKTNRLIHWKYD